MASIKECSAPATCGAPTESLTTGSASTRAVDVVDVSTLDNVPPVCPQAGSVAVESGLFEEKFDSLKSSRGDGSLTCPGSECRSMANAAANSQTERSHAEGGLQPGSFESISESHCNAVVPHVPNQKHAELSPKKRRKRGASPLVMSPDLRGTAGKEWRVVFFNL